MAAGGVAVSHKVLNPAMLAARFKMSTRSCKLYFNIACIDLISTITYLALDQAILATPKKDGG